MIIEILLVTKITKIHPKVAISDWILYGHLIITKIGIRKNFKHCNFGMI
jgi:hypothetical protein